MAVVYKNAVLLVNGRDLSGEMRNVGLTYSADSVEVTTFGNDTHVKRGGLLVAQLTGETIVDWADEAADLLFSITGTDNMPLAVFPNGITEGAICGYAMKGVATQFTLNGATPDVPVVRYQFDAQNRDAAA